MRLFYYVALNFLNKNNKEIIFKLKKKKICKSKGNVCNLKRYKFKFLYSIFLSNF